MTNKSNRDTAEAPSSMRQDTDYKELHTGESERDKRNSTQLKEFDSRSYPVHPASTKAAIRNMDSQTRTQQFERQAPLSPVAPHVVHAGNSTAGSQIKRLEQATATGGTQRKRTPINNY